MCENTVCDVHSDCGGGYSTTRQFSVKQDSLSFFIRQMNISLELVCCSLTCSHLLTKHSLLRSECFSFCLFLDKLDVF